MHWTDDGIILATRRHGESSLILELMTVGHGRHLGLVRGGRSRRLQPVLQPGNSVSATWRARLDEHLGNFSVEPVTQRASGLMAGAAAAYGLQIAGALLRLLPERDPHAGLYAALAELLNGLGDPPGAGERMVRFEILLLAELGFGLDLSCCAATGRRDDLAFVSPKTGRAVSRTAGAPYRDRLLDLPAFLLDTRRNAPPSPADLLAAFRLTGYFLDRHAFEPRGLAAPAVRDAFLMLVGKAALPEDEFSRGEPGHAAALSSPPGA